MPPEQLPVAIQTLAEPLLNPIKAAMQQFTPSLGAGGDTTLATQLPLFDRLATMFESLPVQHVPAASILQQAWPSLDVALLRAGQDGKAIERLCRCVWVLCVTVCVMQECCEEVEARQGACSSSAHHFCWLCFLYCHHPDTVPASASAVLPIARRTLRYGIKASNKACANMLPVLLEALPGRFQQVQTCVLTCGVMSKAA